ncbi:MAG: S8 family peptidase [Symbiobacteriia bacterium]
MRKWLSLLLVLVLALGVLSVPAAASAPTHRITVVFKSATLPSNAAAIITAAGGQVTAQVPALGVLYAIGPVSMLDSLNANSAVLAANPSIELKLGPAKVYEDTSIQPDSINTAKADLYNAYQWDIKQVTGDGASWALDAGSHNTVVGIIDTGVNVNHADLKANLLGGRNFVPAGGYYGNDPTETGDPSDYVDRHGHGSHVAGTIAGSGRIIGVGPALGFRSYRIFQRQGGAPTLPILQAILAATDDGVNVISMSIGGYDTIAKYTWTDPATGTVYKGKDVADFRAYERAVKYAVKHGIVVVAAAGNEATDIGNPTAITAYLNATYGPLGYAFQGASREVPGTLPGVVTVSATGPDQSLASYSNYGAGAIDVSAPGGDFQRYPSPGWFTDLCLSAYKEVTPGVSNYVWMAGTSMATPKVSAIAALIIDQAKANGKQLSPSQAVTLLQQTSVDLGKPGYDPYFGHGFASAYTALGGK